MTVSAATCGRSVLWKVSRSGSRSVTETTSSLLSEIAGWRSTKTWLSKYSSQKTRRIVERRAAKDVPARRVDSTESEGETEEVLTLNDLKVGETAVVVKLHGQGAVRRRIMDMGITKGVPVRVRKFAPLGDPVEITVLDYELTLRKNDCALIEVEKRSSDSEQSAL
jgi:ferrous iron transport protein A